jgi:hypothetical protein
VPLRGGARCRGIALRPGMGFYLGRFPDACVAERFPLLDVSADLGDSQVKTSIWPSACLFREVLDTRV